MKEPLSAVVSILVSTGVFLLFIAALLGLGFLFDTCDERHRDARLDAGVEVVRPVKQLKIGGALIVADDDVMKNLVF